MHLRGWNMVSQQAQAAGARGSIGRSADDSSQQFDLFHPPRDGRAHLGDAEDVLRRHSHVRTMTAGDAVSSGFARQQYRYEQNLHVERVGFDVQRHDSRT